jgi:hypothetical protein
LCIIHKEMKGLCLSVQFKAYCRVGEEGRLLSKGIRNGSTIVNIGIILKYMKWCTFLKKDKKD